MVLASTSRREAILKGLSELGYEVRENMVTACAEDGRIVVKKLIRMMMELSLGLLKM